MTTHHVDRAYLTRSLVTVDGDAAPGGAVDLGGRATPS